MTAAFWPIQEAVFTRLRSDPGLVALLDDPAPVFDAPPETAHFPYILIGAMRAEPLDGAEGGLIHTLTIRVFSRYEGRREIKEILYALYEALQDAEIPLGDSCPARLRQRFVDILPRQANGVTEAITRFRATTVPNPSQGAQP